jgi:hypothetical protein
MRKLAPLAISITLTLALCINGIAQTSANSTPEKNSNSANVEVDAGAEQVIARLVREAKTSRELIDAFENELKKREKQIELEKQNSASIEKSYAGAERELATLRLALDVLRAAFDNQGKALAVVTDQRDKERAGRKKANKRAAIATIGSFALIILKFIK